jgi:hypothetical protein
VSIVSDESRYLDSTYVSLESTPQLFNILARLFACGYQPLVPLVYAKTKWESLDVGLLR